MAATQLIPVSEYLNTSYRPDVDYLEGELEERNLGERDHGKLQLFFAVLFDKHRREWHLEVIPELRVQVREDRFRVPDLCILAANAPREQFVRTPPILCIEILSPADTIQRMRERVRDFSRWAYARSGLSIRSPAPSSSAPAAQWLSRQKAPSR